MNYKRNIKEYLCRSRVDQHKEYITVSKCTISRCATCKIITEEPSFTSNNGKIVKQDMDCESKYSLFQWYLISVGISILVKLAAIFGNAWLFINSRSKNNDLRFVQMNKCINFCSGNSFSVSSLYKVYPTKPYYNNEKKRFLINL